MFNGIFAWNKKSRSIIMERLLIRSGVSAERRKLK